MRAVVLPSTIPIATASMLGLWPVYVYMNMLDYAYKSITFGTFGAFGSGTWDVIERACDPRTHPDATGDYDPWRRPGPKRDFILSLGFALQRANVRMLRGSSLRRRRNRAKDCFASGSRSQ